MGELIFRPLALLPLISTISILSTIIFYLWKAKRSGLFYSLLMLQLLIMFWPLGQAIQYCASDDRLILLTIYPIHTAVNFVGLAWLVFAIYFTSSNGKIGLKRIAPLAILPLLTYIFFLTNQYHHLYFKTVHYDPEIVIYYIYGPVFWLGVLHEYAYILAGLVILVKYALNQTGVTKGQALILIMAPLASFFSSLAFNIYTFVARIESPRFFDLTPTLFSVTMLLFTIAAFKFRFLNINPGALKKVFEDLHDSIVVIDNYHTIVNFNQSFTANFGCYRINDKVNRLAADLRQTVVPSETALRMVRLIECGTDKAVEMGEIELPAPAAKSFKVIIQKLDHHKKVYQGRIIIFHDITDAKRLLAEVNLKNQELSTTNQRLSNHLQTVAELAIATERNRVAREVHDTLGHTLTALIVLMKAARIQLQANPTDTFHKLSEGIVMAQAELNELRRSISDLKSQDRNQVELLANLRDLVQQGKNLGINIKFAFYGQAIFNALPVTVRKIQVADTVYKIAKEALTNSIRHGNASKIELVLKFSCDQAELLIVDNGIGCPVIEPGFGLSGMKERVGALNGSIRFGSDAQNGFNIRVLIPLAEEAEPAEEAEEQNDQNIIGGRQ